MDYKKLKIAELQELLDKKKIKYMSSARKKELINLLEKKDGKTAEKETKIEKLIAKKILVKDIKKKNIQEFTKPDLKKIDKIIHLMVGIARKTNNIIDDVALDLELNKIFGANYGKEYFLKIEKQLELKNIEIKYTSDKLLTEISGHKNMDFEAGEEEINYNIESLLKGISKTQNNDEIKNFLSTINDYPLLTKEKEFEVCTIIKKYSNLIEEGKKLTIFEIEKYEDARDLLILSNKRLVVSIAKKHINRGMDLIDLVMEGMIGLEKALQKYEPEAGFKFSTYATWWIRQGITRAIADKSKVIRVPVHMVETINKVAKIQRELLQKNGIEPTSEEIGQEITPKMTAEQVNHIFDISKDPIPLEMPVGEDNSSLEAFIEDTKNVSQVEESEQKELRESLINLIYEIPLSEGEVLLYRYGLYELNTSVFEKKKKILKYIIDGLIENKITSIDAEIILETTDKLTDSQKHRIVKRIKSNNQNYELLIDKLKDYEEVTTKIELKSREDIQKRIDAIKDANIKHLETIIDNCNQRIKIIKKIKKLTCGVIKPLTLEEVGQLFDVTRERIRQIENKGKRKLKSFAEKSRLDLFIK